jgi:prepilin-type N-terminal cleavage/methylation domain-containing protein
MKIDSTRTNSKRGFTLIELLVVMGIIALLLAILLPALGKARATAKRVKDSTQVQQVHKGFITLSTDYGGIYPTPGLIDRVGNIPGKGAEDLLMNDHGKMYSACIMQHAFDTNVLVSPAEVSTAVLAMANYNFDSYNVTAANDQYWDPNFKSDLTAISNVSYGTLHLAGTRKAKEWKASYNPRFVVVGNRGVKDGSLAQQDYNNSKTLGIHGGDKQWEGNECFNDNHVVFVNNFQPDGITQFGSANPLIDDNIFKDDPEAATSDTWLTMISQVTGGGANYTYTITWD